MEEQTEQFSQFSYIIELVGRAVDGAGVLVIVLGVIVATVVFLRRAQHKDASDSAYRNYREGLGRALLIGLEVLVAADIIRTVAVTPTFQSVGVLAIIVVIRTFLSWSLEVELEGRWPWQQRRGEVGSLGRGDVEERVSRPTR